MLRFLATPAIARVCRARLGAKPAKSKTFLNFLYKGLLKLRKAQFCKTKNLVNNEQRKTRLYKGRHADPKKCLRKEGEECSSRLQAGFARIKSSLCAK